MCCINRDKEPNIQDNENAAQNLEIVSKEQQRRSADKKLLYKRKSKDQSPEKEYNF